METLKLRQQQRSALTTRPTPVYRNLPAQLAFSQRSCQHISLFPFPQTSASPKLRFFAHTQTESLTAFRQTLANEKFGVIFTFCASALLPVRAWRDSRLYSASERSGPKKLAHRKLCVRGYGALWESVRRLCAL